MKYRTKVNESDFRVEIVENKDCANNTKRISSANVEDYKYNNCYSQSNDKLFGENSQKNNANTRVSRFNVGNNDDTWNSSSRYTRHYQILPHGKVNERTSKTIDIAKINLDQPLSNAEHKLKNSQLSNRLVKRESGKSGDLDLKKRQSSGAQGGDMSASESFQGRSSNDIQLKMKSFLFKNETIWFHKNVPDLCEYARKIIENSGKFFCLKRL